MMVRVLLVLANWIISTWSMCGLFMYIGRRLLGRRAPVHIRFLFSELKPFYLPALVTYPVLLVLVGGKPTSFNELMFIGFAALNWFYFRHEDDDDDRWKRRLRKVAEKVARSGSRLVVVAAGGQR